MFSPRVGLQLGRQRATASSQLRGGVGIFSGRTPYVWLSNQYGNTGIEFQRIGASLQRRQPDPLRDRPRQPAHQGHGRRRRAAFTNEIDLVDPDFKFPKVLRGNVAYDRDLGFGGLIGTVEFL